MRCGELIVRALSIPACRNIALTAALALRGQRLPYGAEYQDYNIIHTFLAGVSSAAGGSLFSLALVNNIIVNHKHAYVIKKQQCKGGHKSIGNSNTYDFFPVGSTAAAGTAAAAALGSVTMPC